MSRASGLVSGSLSEGQRARRPFTVEPGDCLRVFAAGGEGIEDLDVSVTTKAGRLLGKDDSRKRWVVIEPERPVCSPTGGELELTVQAVAGSGRFAVEIWHMPARGTE
jgi:hypothetical protein